MPRIKHIALTTKEPGKVAAFYKEAFGMEEIRRAPNGALTHSGAKTNSGATRTPHRVAGRPRREHG